MRGGWYGKNSGGRGGKTNFGIGPGGGGMDGLPSSGEHHCLNQ